MPIRNISEKNPSNIIKEFEKIGKLTYEKRIPKHDPTPSYFHLVRKLVKCMMISNEYNWHIHRSYAEDTALSLNINVMDKDESKEMIVRKILSEN